jgi:hypothetical protein
MRRFADGWLIKVQDVVFTGGPAEVVAIETESGQYIANGHLTHNCLPKDLASLVHQMDVLGLHRVVDDEQARKLGFGSVVEFICEAALARNRLDRERKQ